MNIGKKEAIPIGEKWLILLKILFDRINRMFRMK
jgi:hypothetical protein